jgi:hypothetical protein
MAMSNWTPNYDQITGIVRAAVPAITAWLAARGIEGNTWIDILVVVIVTLGACVWSVLNNKSGKTIP